MKTFETATPGMITFQIRTRSQEYGDKRVFIEYKILFLDGKSVVGVEIGPRRQTVTRADSLKAARARIRTLRSHRLFAIRITKKHIDDGEARKCNTCAIAQALWHNQERMGYSKYEFSFEVAPYGAWVDPRGIVLNEKYGDEIARIPNEKLPELVTWIRGKEVYSDDLATWAMQYDEWAESRCMSLKEWREENDREPDERPSRPGPSSFVLDLDEMVPASPTIACTWKETGY